MVLAKQQEHRKVYPLEIDRRVLESIQPEDKIIGPDGEPYIRAGALFGPYTQPTTPKAEVIELYPEKTPQPRDDAVITYPKYMSIAARKRATMSLFGELERYRAMGDEENAVRTRNEIMVVNDPFVVYVANQIYKRLSEPLSRIFDINELVSQGHIGLARAINTFDPAKGYLFTTYAVWWVKQAITYEIQQRGRTIRIPANKVLSLKKLAKKHRNVLETYGEDAFHETLRQELGIDPETYAYLNLEPFYLQTPLGDDKTELGDVVPAETLPDAEIIEKDAKEIVSRTIRKLPSREEIILRMYFGIEPYKTRRNLEEIGKEMSLSRERVRQLKKKALKMLENNEDMIGVNGEM